MKKSIVSFMVIFTLLISSISVRTTRVVSADELAGTHSGYGAISTSTSSGYVKKTYKVTKIDKKYAWVEIKMVWTKTPSYRLTDCVNVEFNNSSYVDNSCTITQSWTESFYIYDDL
ncbi:MAG: hypothetical protein K6G85_05850 [Eubacterium sp.]|nr:hypothetical protein [Eubacterium sp.]